LFSDQEPPTFLQTAVKFELTVSFPEFSAPMLEFSLLTSVTALQCFFQKVVPPVHASKGQNKVESSFTEASLTGEISGGKPLNNLLLDLCKLVHKHTGIFPHNFEGFPFSLFLKSCIETISGGYPFSASY
jgi:hypothetical protein